MYTRINRRNLLNLIFGFLTIIIYSACQKVINVDLNNAAPHIVIEGLITDRPGPYSVKISKSGSYFNQPVLPPVTGADVNITDDSGTVDTLKETMPGIYITTRIHGTTGRTYTLKVISENQEYTGESTMFSHVHIDSVNLTKTESLHFGFGGGSNNVNHVDLNCFFKDPYEKNFYRLKVSGSDTTINENYRLFDDQYTNGQEIELRAARAKAGDTIRIELYSLDKQTYGYYRTLEDLLRTNPFFGSTPANPNSNLTNGALGYFGVSAVSSRTVIITDSYIKTAQ